ncbi:MAG: CoA pyrophosphatase [Gammaproteobacteria bacterium]|nr:CoA pyrophosphatase [Gammaproteobacteria bacterium]
MGEALQGTKPGSVEQAFESLATPGDLPGNLRGLIETPLREAAVLVPIIDYPDEPALLLTRRTDALRQHPGQISFPGGALEETDEGPVGAAVRETEEETGMDTTDLEILGFLDTYLTITSFAITPVVARIPPGKPLRPDPAEVAELFEVPLKFVLDRANVRRHVGRRGELRVSYYSIPYQDKNIWGATAGMLVNLSSKIF